MRRISLAASILVTLALPAARGEEPVYLEDYMTEDEIYAELIAGTSGEKSVPPKGQIEGPEQFALPITPDSLPVAPTGRLADLIPDHLYGYFDLYLYVNKATTGLWSQQMFIFGREGEDAFKLESRILVSTGRERYERYFTTTPTGLFRLDPGRFFPAAVSRRWDGTAMPWAMFFDYSYRTRKSGLAIHAATPNKEVELGSRASGGCVRVSLNHAETLFKRIQDRYAGKVPVFPFDRTKGHTKRDGSVARDAEGRVRLTDGYRVLVVIDDVVVRPNAHSEGQDL